MEKTFNLRRLTWDSEFFGYPVASVTLNSATYNFDTLREAAQPFKLVYVHSSDQIVDPNLVLGDKKLVFGKRPENMEMDIRVVEAEMTDINKLKAIGVQGGVYSRFLLDPKFEQNEFERLYCAWVERSLSNHLAYRVLTVKKNGEPLGIITLSEGLEGESKIGLFAVAEQSRGEGVGKALLRAADQVSFSRNDKRLTVVTQGKNNVAQTVYQKHGFAIDHESYVYNYWNDEHKS
jgi:GNAT superfamily N-acetyltransferase